MPITLMGFVSGITLTVFMLGPNVMTVKIYQVIVKLEDYIRTSKQDWLPLLPALLAAGCREQQEAQLLDELLAKLTVALGRIDVSARVRGDRPLLLETWILFKRRCPTIVPK